jgi:hypothetical protein
MKKLIPLFVVGIVVLCGLEAVAVPFNVTQSDVQLWKVAPQKTFRNDDELDQSQPTMNWFGPVGVSSFWGNLNYVIAQGFTPTKNLLTKAEILVTRNNSTSYDFKLGLRADLNESDLVSISVSAAEIPINNYSWVEFDFPDTMITPGQIYYLVASTTNITNNYYGWGLNLSNVYPNGTVSWTTNDGANWIENSTFDLAFKTYGSQAAILNLSITGGIGVTVSTKNIGGINANNVTTHLTITGGIFGLINISLDDNTSTLVPGDALATKKLPLGLGPITIVATARAENAVEVTKTVNGLILFFLVIMK